MNSRNHRHALRFARSSPIYHVVAAFVLLVLAVTACSAPAPATPRASRASTPTQPPQPTTVPTAAISAEAGPVKLVWWTPEFLSPQASQPAGSILAGQLQAYSEAQGGKVQVETVRKARYGKGGLLDSLRTAQPVAKTMLPDIVALDTAEVEKAVEAGLLQPLNPLLGTGVTENLYPFASEAGLFNKRLYAVQYLADVDHGAYLPAQVAEPPATWKDLIASKLSYLFPLVRTQAGSSQSSSAMPPESASSAVLSQYLSAGATLGPDRGLVLEPQPLLRLLTFYADGLKAGVLPAPGQAPADEAAVWNEFSQGRTATAYVGARQFIARGDTPAEFAAAPGYEGPAPSLADGWALAIVTTDPNRQRAAAELIAWLLKPENAGAWAATDGWLPTSSDALKTLGSGPYWSFLDAQLAQAHSLPAGPDYATTAARIQTAIDAVLTGQSDPAAATDAAMNGQ
jgi:ABC-type glycerol-3-phosphate transport system substrate-binding protein